MTVLERDEMRCALVDRYPNNNASNVCIYINASMGASCRWWDVGARGKWIHRKRNEKHELYEIKTPSSDIKMWNFVSVLSIDDDNAI